MGTSLPSTVLQMSTCMLRSVQRRKQLGVVGVFFMFNKRNVLGSLFSPLLLMKHENNPVMKGSHKLVGANPYASGNPFEKVCFSVFLLLLF